MLANAGLSPEEVQTTLVFFTVAGAATFAVYNALKARHIGRKHTMEVPLDDRARPTGRREAVHSL